MRAFVVACVAALGSSGVAAAADSDAVRASVEIEVEYAASTADGRAQKLESRVEPRVDVSLPGGFSLTAIGRLRIDAFDELEPGNPRPEETSALQGRLLYGDHGGAQLREFYVAGQAGPAHLTLGKQQIVWGKADGLKVLDRVNPQDFREFILDAFEDSRIPLWAANVEVPVGDATLQFLWLPDPTFHALPDRDALYAFTSRLVAPRPATGLPLALRKPDVPRRLISDSDIGGRINGFWRGWDWSLNYLYHYRDEPVYVRRVEPGPIETLTPEYERSHLVGGSFSNAFGDLTIRGELAYSFRRFFLKDPTAVDADGVGEVDELESVIGLDWYGFSDTLITGQLFQRWITTGYSDLTRDRLEQIATLFVTRRFSNDTIEARVGALHSLNRNDGLLRARLRFDVDDFTRVWVGGDLFYGTSRGLFGEFDENDRIFAGFEFSF